MDICAAAPCISRILYQDALHDGQKKHLVRIVTAETVVGHGIATIGGFHLIAAKFLAVRDDITQR